MDGSVLITSISNSHTDEAVKGFHVGPVLINNIERIMTMPFGPEYRIADQEDLDDDLDDDDDYDDYDEDDEADSYEDDDEEDEDDE